MAIHLTKLVSFARSNRNRWPRQLSGYIITSKRYIQEFPELRYDNKLRKDHLIVLPESLADEPKTNELFRIPKIGEKETDFSNLNAEKVFKAASYSICSFEDFIADVNNEVIPLEDITSLEEFFKNVESNLFLMDTIFNTLNALFNIDHDRYNHKEIFDLLSRYWSARDMRLFSNFKSTIEKLISETDPKSLKDIDKILLQIYYPRSSRKNRNEKIGEKALLEYRKYLQDEIINFTINLNNANQFFSHTVDDPDILSSISSEFYQSQDLHHKKRTPLKIGINTYQRFMQLCPDRFIRQNLWQVRNKRCSPKAHPKLNNISVINSIRGYRRKIADLLGYRSHVEFRLERSTVNSKQEVLDTFEFLHHKNISLINERLQELNDYAADNAFDGSSQIGLQEFDIDYWTHKYKHEILIGKNENELKQFFPLPKVVSGIQKFFSDYLGIDIKNDIDGSKKYWNDKVNVYQVFRKNEHIGTLIHDAYSRESKRLLEPSSVRLRSRNNDFGCLPMRLISTSYNIDTVSNQTLLSFHDVIDLFFSYGSIIQRLLYNYKYYELNVYGAIEMDAINLFPYFCVGHLLSDYRVLQACSVREGSKSLDAETAQRIQKASIYFNSFKRWHDLYKAHLDLEVHSSLTDVRSISKDLYMKYSPFGIDADNYGFCAMAEIFAGPNDGLQYSELWSKQLVNYCMNSVTGKSEDGQEKDMNLIDVSLIKEFNVKLVDQLFHPEDMNTRKKLESLVGTRFEPSKTDLGVL